MPPVHMPCNSTRFTFRSKWDIQVTMPTVDELPAPEYHKKQGRSRKLQKMTAKARSIFRALDAYDGWVPGSDMLKLAGWKRTVRVTVTNLHTGEVVHDGPMKWTELGLREPKMNPAITVRKGAKALDAQSDAYGKGMDVESHAQMSDRFAGWLETQS